VQIRTLAAILAWIVVALLLLNGIIRSQWFIITSIVLAAFAVLLFFSPRWRKNKKIQDQETQSGKN